MNLFKMSLTKQMAIATALGIFAGLFFGELCAVLAPYASAYVMILKMTAIPYVAFAILHGIGQLTSHTAKEILKKGIFFILLAWCINIAMIYFVNFLFPVSPHSSPYGSWSTKPAGSVDFAELLIPENIFYDLANNIVPPIVIFSLLIGIALMHMKEKHVMMSILDIIVSALSKLTSWIARITPIGTFLIMANQVGTTQFTTIQQVITYITLYVFGTCLVIFWIFPRIVSMLTDIKALSWIKDLAPILLLGYTTNVVIVCIPYMIELIKQKLFTFVQKNDKAEGEIQGIVSILFNLPLGSLFISIFILFISYFYSHPFSVLGHVQQLTLVFLTGLGSIGLGSLINNLTFILDSLNLPVDSVNLFLTTIPFTAGFQTMVSVMEISSLALLITFSTHHLIHFKIHRFLHRLIMTAAFLIVIFFGLKIYNFLPEIRNTSKTICEFQISTSALSKLYYDGERIGSRPESSLDIFARIKESKILRVGYNSNAIPFSFFNDQEKLVGYDTAFAYKLAENLGCEVEFVPLNYAGLKEELDLELYDIAMSAITINEQRLKDIAFTDPYLESPIVIVGPKKKSDYKTFEELQEVANLKIAVLKGSAFVAVAKTLFPHAEIILLSNYEEYASKDGTSYLLWSEEGAISWLIRHRQFTILPFGKTLGIMAFGYAIKQNALQWQSYLNQWLKLKKEEGFTEKQYNKWFLGKPYEEKKPLPRWSILRNIFHWNS